MRKWKGCVWLRECSDTRVGGLVGFLVRDALGVGFEFKTPNLLPPAQLVATKAL